MMDEAGAVEENVGPFELGGERRDGFAIRHIEHAHIDPVHPAELGEPDLVHVRRENMRAFVCEREPGRLADTLRCRRNENYLAFEPLCHSSSRGSLWEAGAGSMSGWPSMMRAHVFQRSTASSLPSGLSFCAFS